MRTGSRSCVIPPPLLRASLGPRARPLRQGQGGGGSAAAHPGGTGKGETRGERQEAERAAGAPTRASLRAWKCFRRPAVRGRGWLPQLLQQPEAKKSRKGRREPELSVTRPVAQLSDKSRVNSSSYRNEALASHGGSLVLNVAPQTERKSGSLRAGDGGR